MTPQALRRADPTKRYPVLVAALAELRFSLTDEILELDGQRFPFTVRNPSARAMRRYYTGTGATIYTWTSDQHSQYGTRLIPTTV